MNVAFIGLGKMGIGMAHNLLRAGHKLTIYNRTPGKAAELEAAGARSARTPEEAAAGAEIAFSMLADDRAVEAVVFGKNGLAAGLSEKAIHASSSTISIALSKQLDSEHASRGQRYVSAPVFGRPEAAEAKKLLVILGGKSDEVDAVQPLAEAIGRQTFVVGAEAWQANALKLAGNFMIGSMLESFAEAFALMRKANVDVHDFLAVMLELFGSPVYRTYGTNAADRNFDPAGFALRLGLKDVSLVLDAGRELQAPMPIASVVRDQLTAAMAHGQGELDLSSLSLVAARNAGLD